MKRHSIALLLIAVTGAVHADTLRSQIEASNKITCAAMVKKDFVTLSKNIKSGVTPNFVYVEAGRSQTFDQMIGNMKAGLSGMGKLSRVDSKVVSVKETGKTATCVSQHSIDGVIAGPDGKMHTLQATGLSTESYVKDGAKWKMSKMVWNDGAMTMDGKPMKMRG